MQPKSVPLISVVTASFNAAEFIEHCMQSVLAQEFDDFEYVVIDGGSTDGTRELIEKYGNRLSYWHSTPDRGLAHAFNQGIEHSKGQWIMFLNADDYFAEPVVLEKFAKALRSNSLADVVFGQAVMVSREMAPHPVDRPYGKAFRRWQFVLINTIPHQAAATNRALFQRIGMFSENFGVAMDYEHFLRAGPKLKAQYVPLLVACMRDGGMSRNVGTALRDWHRARIATHTLPLPLCWAAYCYTLCRAFLGRWHRRLLGWPV